MVYMVFAVGTVLWGSVGVSNFQRDEYRGYSWGKVVLNGTDMNCATGFYVGALSNLVDGDWSEFFTPQTNYYFDFIGDGMHLYANVDRGAVPEPASWALLLLGLGLGWKFGFRRRRS